MEFKPSVVPRRLSSSDELSFPSGARRLHSGRESSTSDGLHRRQASKLESELQESGIFSSPRVDHRYSEHESREASVKLASATVHTPGTYNRSWSGSFLESRNRLPSASTSFQSSVYHESERPLGAYSRLHNQQDSDSKRPKLSYSGSTPTSGSSLWRSAQISSSSPGVISSASGTELRGRPLERATPVTSSFGSHSHRTSGISSLACSQDGVSSHVQGARPKDASFSAVNTSSRSHNLSSEHYSSLFSRDSGRNTSRPSESIFPYGGSVSETQVDSSCSRIRHTAPVATATSRRAVASLGHYSSLISRDDCRYSSSRPSESVFLSRDPVSEGSEQDVTCSRNRRAAASTVASERTVSSPRRSFNESAQENDGRITARQLLSRLASSMSNTFLRRSSSESLDSRSDSTNPYSVQRTENSTPSRTNTATPETSDSRPSESPQSFSFLGRRRQGFNSPSHQSSVDVELSRQYNSGRSTGSWLSSSIRNRCTPLFSRTRREGRDESARMAANPDESDGLQHPFIREPSLGEQGNDLLRTTDSGSVSPQMVNTTASTANSSQMRNARISRALPTSLLRFAVPSGIGSNLSDSVLITVDIMPPARDHSERRESQDSSARDPEKLRKLQESLLLEDSEEEEGDLCRICQMGEDSPTNPLIEAPCKCTGSLQYVHQECMKKWLISKINSGSSFEAVNTCELCKEKLNLNLENFDIHELYRAHAAEQAEFELISSGLYLVVLFHLCDQRFSNMLWAANEASTLRFFNLARSLGAQMDDLETSDESEDDESEEDNDLN
ncbi:E3 ubiquitin-protein ligase MARCHF7 isoform X1 [Protopterus annectens]|uniref:E3 ubiquitin-protein ligase MARCHF7 isoform X1 n=1 Tax=Protopterus annectens TaxID=7888 RepID=UPI001CFB6C30|nr:E3 ubiquitin-protein ligase MARCHF7 isoform X1 [Protopterus annectens]